LCPPWARGACSCPQSSHAGRASARAVALEQVGREALAQPLDRIPTEPSSFLAKPTGRYPWALAEECLGLGVLQLCIQCEGQVVEADSRDGSQRTMVTRCLSGKRLNSWSAGEERGVAPEGERGLCAHEPPLAPTARCVHEFSEWAPDCPTIARDGDRCDLGRR